MKKILLFFFLLMSIGMWGTIANPYSFTFSKGDLTTSSTSFTKDEVTWSLSETEDQWNGNDEKNGYVFGSAGDPKTLTISTSNILGIITQISVIGRSNNKDKLATLSVSVGSSTFTTSDNTWDSGSNQTLIFNGSSSGVISITINPNTCGYGLYGISVEYSSTPIQSTYAVAYDANGGTGTITDSNSPYNSGSTVTVLENLFTREGYTFTNWNTKANGSGTSYSKYDTFTINSDITLYAQWVELPIPVSDCIFSESFTESTGTMGWSGSAANGTFNSDNAGWTVENSYGAGGSAKFGTGSKQGRAETPSIQYNGSSDLILTFNSGAWDGSSEVTMINLSADNATLSQNSITLTKGSWTTYTIRLINVSNNFKIKWEANTSSNNRFFLDDICISEVETCLPTISVTKIEQSGTFDLSSDSVCENGSVVLSNIMPSEGYKFDTIICIAQEGKEFVEHGTVNISNSTISGITKDCYVIVIFSQLPPNPEIEIVEWNPDYIKVDIDNFDAVTAVIENKNTQEVHEDNVATELFFSKYFEAETTIKMLGIYNGKQDSLNLSDYIIKAGDGTKGVSWEKTYNLSNLGWIHSGEEIILYSYSDDANTTTVVNCINNHGTGFSKYIQVKTGGLVNGSLTFNGDDAIGLFKNDKLIDIIGAGTSEAICVTRLKGKTNGKDTTMYETHLIDNYCWITDTADNANGYSNVIATDLCLLIRKSNVHSGDSAVKYNTTDFVTLGREWFGKLVSKKDSSTCKNFDYIGSFNYNEHYSQYTQVGEDITLASKLQPDGSYKISIPDLDTLSCTLLKVIVNDKSDKSEEREYKIPIFVTENTESNSLISQEGVDCPECDVVIIKGGKLTVNSELTNRDVTVYPGGVLVIPTNQTYNVNSLTLRRDNDSVPYFSYKGTLNTNKFNIDLRTDANDWRWMTLPFAIHTDSIKLSNGKPINLNNNVWISYYDGKHRSIYQRNAWKDIYKDTIFNAGEGFLFGVDLPGKSKKIYRFSFNKEDSIDHEKSDKIIRNLYAWGGDNPNLASNHKGWNLIGNPFMDSDTTDIIDPIRIGRLKKDSVNGQWTGSWVVDSITTKLRYAVIPNKKEEFADAGYYESVVLDDYVLQPLTSFFVQIGGNENDMQTLTFKPEKRTNRIVARRTPINEKDEELFLRIKIGNKKTGCFISNHFNENYEPGDDLESRYAYYQLINGYKLLYSAINDSIIENGIQIHSLGEKVTLDPKVETEKFEQIYILYNNVWYDLLHGDEPEVNGDFILYGKRKISEDIPTDINNIKPGQGTYKFLHENNIFINNKGKIYNILGNSIQ